MNSYLSGKYQVACYMRIDLEDEDAEDLSLREAEEELKQLKFIQPENIYQIERIDDGTE